VTDLPDLRSQFPVLDRVAYLNAGTNGPIPRRAAEAAAAELTRDLEHGRAGAGHFERIEGLGSELRGALAALLGCSADELALTRSTTDGVNTVLAGIGLRPGDVLLTSDEEHPGLLAPLAGAARRAGAEVRAAPFAEVAAHATSEIRLVACSHVSWMSGQVLGVEALRATGVPFLLDGAQALGAIPIDVGALGCDYYAASGQKWLCGPEGSGCLYVRADRVGSLAPPWPSYMSLADPGRPAELAFHEAARRLDTLYQSADRAAWALVSLEALGETGWDRVHERGPALAASLAERLADRGARVSPRGRSTLVSWQVAAGEARSAVERLGKEEVVVRDVPGAGLLRASVGAWSSETDLDRLLTLV
jgi:L-cysteine/cystine lyase